MKNIIKTAPKYWLLIILSLITGGLLAFWFTKQITAPPTSNEFPTPATKELTLINQSPKQESFEAANTMTPIFFTFNQPVDINTLTIDVQPIQELDVQIRPNNFQQVVINPKTPWKENQTLQLKIRRGLKSIDGQFVLNNDISNSFTIIKIPLPELNQPL